MKNSFKIKNKIIKNFNNPFIIAEAGVNHNGNIKIAKKLIDVASKAGADAIKFQTFKTDNIVTKKSPKSSYHKITGGSDKDQSWYKLLKSQELNFKQHQELVNYCLKKKIIFLSTPYDFDSVDMLCKLNIPAFKIASTDNNNYPLLKYISKKNKPILLSTGMTDMKEIVQVVKILKNYNQKEIAIMQCTSSYPCELKNLNLSIIKTLQKRFKCPIGFSDHSTTILPAVISTTMGSAIYEKHLTLDKNMTGPDHKASCSPSELEDAIKQIRMVSLISGNKIKRVLNCEKENRIKLKKSLVANYFIKAGMKLNRNLVGIKRPSTGMDPSFYDQIFRYKAKVDIKADTILLSKMLKKK
jgi:N-acetylneuraminate synthase/N,N'-diacetyllegionaminate synthase